MRSCHSLDRLDVTFDDERLVANAGLMFSATLAQQLGSSTWSTAVSIWVMRPGQLTQLGQDHPLALLRRPSIAGDQLPCHSFAFAHR
jgi:hypothetical protein